MLLLAANAVLGGEVVLTPLDWSRTPEQMKAEEEAQRAHEEAMRLEREEIDSELIRRGWPASREGEVRKYLQLQKKAAKLAPKPGAGALLHGPADASSDRSSDVHDEWARRRMTDTEAQSESSGNEPARSAIPEEERVAYREGIVLCKRYENDGKVWGCQGPLQNNIAVLDTPAADNAIRLACGGGSVRDLGMVSGFRAFGCGFGIHPTNRSAGNYDVAARLGIDYIPNRGTYYCNPRSVSHYCKER